MGEPNWDELFPWLERELGGKITRRQRQGRDSGGRPAWFLDFEVRGNPLRTYIRGSRDPAFEYSKTYSLEREARVLRTLHGAGIPVPEVLAYCPEPAAIAMECVEGRDNFNDIEDPGARDAIARHFMDLLVEFHALDPALFEAVGIERPKNANQTALGDLEIWERAYRAGTREPVPLMTFTSQWLRRNTPQRESDVVLCQGDTGPGNFIFGDDRVLALVDWEMAHLTHPMVDLACVRSRDLYYPIGDFAAAVRRYSELSGREIDYEALHYYSVKTMLIVPMSLAPVMENLNPRTDHAEWIAQYVFYLRTTAEALADAIGLELEAPALPDAPASERSHLFDILIDNLRDEQRPEIEEPFLRSRMDLTIRLSQHLQRIERWGPQIDAQELDDLGEVLGKRPENRREGFRSLDALVREAGPDRDPELVQYFYRNAIREESLMRGALGLAESGTLSRLR